ncbi:hypothetical protein CTEN210_09060 [Chaetoceros tenuissimus]|uniref:Uncharacterized protein n=1 Tax=Chaetoceros tenuissimus TaxID=426638 RepID=A0AAD3CVE7_9STRA|nr:hypothetical protein CTEN210_09060 [Chaetoceros tenuissimus]
MFQSLSLILGPFAATNSPWTLGNQELCNFQGLMFVAGTTGVPFYSAGLAVYYFCRLYKNMSEERIFHKVEKKMHIFIFYFVLLINVFALVKLAINSGTTATTCAYAATPTGCRLQDDVECDENMDTALVLRIIVLIIFPFASLVVIVTLLSLLLWKIAFRERILPPHPVSTREQPADSDEGNGNTTERSTRNDEVQALRSSTVARRSLPANSYRKEMMWQLISYSIVFILTYIPLCSILLLRLLLSKQEPHIVLYFWLQFCGPIQGFFNILIFNRPDARVIKYKYPSLSWSRAFWLVFIHGGDSASITEEEIGIVERSKEDQDAEKFEAELNEVIDAAANDDGLGGQSLQCGDHGRFKLLSDIPEDSTTLNKKSRVKKEYVAYKGVVVPF